MDKSILWSLRLGFSARQAPLIRQLGLGGFLKRSFDVSFDTAEPDFLNDDPRSLKELRDLREMAKNADSEQARDYLKKQLRNNFELKCWWIDAMAAAEFPLREKMTCFWHNHFVSTSQKVKVNFWVYQHNMVLREHAFGNLKTLTKKILRTNAMIRYLDNNDNRKGRINENLSRELLELFTLGIGNYTEDDIRNGAKALAGLSIGADGAVYRPMLEDNDPIDYLGKHGIFKCDELVDRIFEQPNAPYRVTKKILQWFLYDEPDEKMVSYYGDYLRAMDFEIKPLLTKMFTEEYRKDLAGTKIKDPLLFALQLFDELQVSKIPSRAVAVFLKQQGMDLFNQPNVKGWDGGRAWLSSQIFLQRNTVADLLCNGRSLNRGRMNAMSDDENPAMREDSRIDVRVPFPRDGDNRDVIASLTDRLLFSTDEALQQDFEKLLKYDFDPASPGAENAVLRLFNDMVKTAEFQLI